MDRDVESKEGPEISQAYASGLREYISTQGEAALKRAYDLGRKASVSGVGVLELAWMHHEALSEALAGRPAGADIVALAAHFLAEAISPFEMAFRSYKENARLLGLSEVLAKQNEESDRAYSQLRTILNATTAVIYLKDAEGRYLFVNRQFQYAFGVPFEQVIGKSDHDIFAAPMAHPFHDDDQRAMDHRTPLELEESFQFHDTVQTYLSLKFPLLDASGNSYAICSVSTDITERKKADEALQKAKEAAEAANRELESFSYSVAHDLRAPLRSIHGFGEALLEDCGDQLDSTGKQHLRQILESSHHMWQLIEALLALARVASGELRREKVDLSQLARSIAVRLQEAEPARKVCFDIQAGVVQDADAQLVAALLDNLIGNAWKFTNKKSGARIEFGIDCGDTPKIYFVRDNGAGFDMQYADRLFGVFQRLHTAGEFEGTGIGLATVQRIVRRHGGVVWAEGHVDQGATFYFTLEPKPDGMNFKIDCRPAA